MPIMATVMMCLAAAFGGGTAEQPPPSPWQPAARHLLSDFAGDVSPDHAHEEYPRPQFVRDRWKNLNGLWDYAVTGPDAPADEPPRQWRGRILVPFPLESALSGVGRMLGPDEVLWYHTSFDVPESWSGDRLLLHFGAVDFDARVWVNGRRVGEHRGGYDPFSFELTDAIKQGRANDIVVAVRDPTSSGGQPRGKQVLEPSGIFYTPSSGIWQTVWLEPAPKNGRIVGVKYTPNAAEGCVDVAVRVEDGAECRVEISDGRNVVSEEVTRRGAARLHIPDPHPWSPDDPFLYNVKLTSVRDGRTLDTVAGYTALRDIGVGPDARGVQRLLLNGKPVFQFGPLDQGFWPGGLYTAPTDDALRVDVEAVKRMGGNMLRKHVKVEPDRFYYWCDRLGVMVWQDMPSPFFQAASGPAKGPPISEKWKLQFERELSRMIENLGNHPSIVMWVPFNEGWGQDDLDWAGQVVLKVKTWDPTRLVDNASGWTDTGVGDVVDMHAYPGPSAPAPEAHRAAVLGEFGGLGLPIKGHTWVDKANWGYVTYKNTDDLTDAYIGLIDALPVLIARGLSAAVYTQTCDVEIEVNGWRTYDRAFWKIDPRRAAAATKRLYGPTPRIRTVLPCAIDGESGIGTWRYTTESPADGWRRPEFDDSDWKSGPGGFGAPQTPGAVVGTTWSTSDIWLRRTVKLADDDAMPQDPYLVIHHDEDAQVYINGVLAASFTGWTTSYTFEKLSEPGRAALKPGNNVIAVHCKQTRGGQNIDVGILDIVRP